MWFNFRGQIPDSSPASHPIAGTHLRLPPLTAASRGARLGDMVVEKLSSALMFGAVRGAAEIVQKLEAARPLSAMAMDMVMRRIGESVTVHGFRSSFRDWAGKRDTLPARARRSCTRTCRRRQGRAGLSAVRCFGEAPGADGGVGAVVRVSRGGPDNRHAVAAERLAAAEKRADRRHPTSRDASPSFRALL